MEGSGRVMKPKPAWDRPKPRLSLTRWKSKLMGEGKAGLGGRSAM